MKLLFFTFIVYILGSLVVHATENPSIRVQDVDNVNEQVTDQYNSIPLYNYSSIRLQSSDNEEFVIEKEFVAQSGLIKKMLQEINEPDPIIPLHNITAKTLTKVIEWCDHHNSDPIPTKETLKYDNVDEWDKTFLQVDQETLFDIILAAYYLDIKYLLDIGTMTVANMIKGKSAEEIRTIFKITNDFTPEEEEQIRKENEWSENSKSPWVKDTIVPGEYIIE